MDLNKIFDVFNKKENYSELEDFKKSTTFKIRMYIKLMKGGGEFKSQIVSFMGTSNTPLNTTEIDTAGDLIINIRSFYWLDQIEVKDVEKEDLNGINIEDFSLCLSNSLRFYEEKEEYEKCIKLRDFQKLLQSL